MHFFFKKTPKIKWMLELIFKWNYCVLGLSCARKFSRLTSGKLLSDIFSKQLLPFWQRTALHNSWIQLSNIHSRSLLEAPWGSSGGILKQVVYRTIVLRLGLFFLDVCLTVMDFPTIIGHLEPSCGKAKENKWIGLPTFALPTATVAFTTAWSARTSSQLGHVLANSCRSARFGFFGGRAQKNNVFKTSWNASEMNCPIYYNF